MVVCCTLLSSRRMNAVNGYVVCVVMVLGASPTRGCLQLRAIRAHAGEDVNARLIQAFFKTVKSRKLTSALMTKFRQVVTALSVKVGSRNAWVGLAHAHDMPLLSCLPFCGRPRTVQTRRVLDETQQNRSQVGWHGMEKALLRHFGTPHCIGVLHIASTPRVSLRASEWCFAVVVA